jgi:formate-dependent phosphoribosylglycinamide formyltransferase (GAR transformylase)
MAPKVLLATTSRWFSTARLAMAFHRVGCEVDLVCPPDHPAFSTRALRHRFRYHGLSPQQSFYKAIRESRPDIVIPCDDVAMRHLHRLYLTTSQARDQESSAIGTVLRVSMGDPVSYPITESREKFLALVREEGVRVPETKTVTSSDQVEQWVAQFGFPAVLKADGTSGGEGVRIVHTLPEAMWAYKTLHAPLATLVAAKRTFIDHDSNGILPWLMQHPRQVSIQRFVAGPDATLAVACWRGEVLACIDAEVLQTSRPKGPATIVRLCDDCDRVEAIKKIVRRLGFTGLCGFDFMIDAANGDAYLIEMNARATQTCSLPLGPQRDLISSFCTAITGQPFSQVPLQLAGDTIALFPMALQGEMASELFQSSYLDLPIDEPDLVQLGMKQTQITFREKLQQKWIQLFSKLGLHQP